MSERRREYVPLRQKVLPGPSQIEALPDSAGFRVVNLLISSLILHGGVAYLLGRWLNAEWLFPIGLVAGMALALTVAWFRYGTGRASEAAATTGGSAATAADSQDESTAEDAG